jgi:SAM-dependent methyltransferase
VLGVEPSPEFCRVLAEMGLPYLQGTLADVQCTTHEAFDVIVMSHVLEHFYDPNEALQQCRQLLAVGGILAVEVPNILKPFRSLDRYFLRYVHPSSFSPQTLVTALEMHGFQLQNLDTGGEDWRSPQHLFVVATKLPSATAARVRTTQPAEVVLRALESYRRRWAISLAPRWYLRSSFLWARRIALCIARQLKRNLVPRDVSNASVRPKSSRVIHHQTLTSH